MNIFRTFFALVFSLFVPLSASAQTVSWTTPATIDPSTASKVSSQFVMSADGSLATEVWKEYVGKGLYVVKARSATVSGGVASWGSVSELSAQDGRIEYLTVRLSADGTRAIAAWIYIKGTTSTAQSAAATIAGNSATWGSLSHLPGSEHATVLSVALSSDGTQALAIYVVRAESASKSAFLSIAGTVNGGSVSWGRSRFMKLATKFGIRLKVQLAADGSLATALWTMDNGANLVLQSASATVSGVTHRWGTVTDLSAPGFDTDYPSLALSADGTRATAAWVRNVSSDVSVVRTRSAAIAGNSATWGATTILSAETTISSNPNVALSQNGRAATAVWLENAVAKSASGTIVGPDATWGVATALSSSSNRAFQPLVYLSADGKSALAMWVRTKGRVMQLVAQSAAGLIDGTAQAWGGAGDVSDPSAQIAPPTGGFSADGLLTGMAFVQGTAGAFNTLYGSFGAVVYPTATPTPMATNTPTPTPTPAATATPVGQQIKQVPIPQSSSNDHHVVLRIRDFPNNFNRDYYGYLLRASDQKLLKIGKFKVRRGYGRLEFHNITPGKYVTFTVMFRSKQPTVVSSRRRTITVK